MQAWAFFSLSATSQKNTHTSNWKHFGHTDVFISTQVYLVLSVETKWRKLNKRKMRKSVFLVQTLKVLTSNTKSSLWSEQDWIVCASSKTGKNLFLFVTSSITWGLSLLLWRAFLNHSFMTLNDQVTEMVAAPLETHRSHFWCLHSEHKHNEKSKVTKAQIIADT